MLHLVGDLFGLYDGAQTYKPKTLRVVYFLLGNSPVSEFYMPTFRNTVPSS
jgi:hypothetical protein